MIYLSVVVMAEVCLEHHFYATSLAMGLLNRLCGAVLNTTYLEHTSC